MKASLLKKVESVLEDLKGSEVQSIEVRGAIAFGVQFQNALAVIAEEDLAKEEEVKVESKKK